MMRIARFVLLVFLVACCLPSCKTPEYMKHTSYFENMPDSGRLELQNAKFEQLKIHPNDILDIKVQPLAVASSIDNSLANATSSSGSSNTATASGSTAGGGILVDQDGNISLPLLGSLHVGGLTIKEAHDYIAEKAAFYYKDPTVSVRFLNLKVSVLGEVMRPGVYGFSTEKNTILDALAQAGDLSIYGKRTNVLLIRDSAGYSTFNRFSLNDMDLVQQNFYYLRQNDVIYVEPNKAKLSSMNTATYTKVGLAISILTMLALIYSQVVKN